MQGVYVLVNLLFIPEKSAPVRFFLAWSEIKFFWKELVMVNCEQIKQETFFKYRKKLKDLAEVSGIPYGNLNRLLNGFIKTIPSVPDYESRIRATFDRWDREVAEKNSCIG